MTTAPFSLALVGRQRRRGFIVGAWFDSLFFLLPPLVALALGVLVATHAWFGVPVSAFGLSGTPSDIAIGVIIHAHLVLVFVRSHGNTGIRRRFPGRFFAVPLLLYLGIVASPWVAVSLSVLATFWDVYHSGAQTFGLCRMYEARAGNGPHEGRRLDFWVNQLLYAGPIVAGVTLVDHLEDLNEFRDIGVTLFTAVPVEAVGVHRHLAVGVLVLGGAFLGYYVSGYIRLHQAGRRVSPQKVFLLVVTGACSIYTWGFNSFGEAFFIMNLFHAVQYFGIVWATEKGNVRHLLRLERVPGGGLGAALALLGLALGYGYWVESLDVGRHSLYAVTLVVSLLHFWYDGFIWSVRRRDV